MVRTQLRRCANEHLLGVLRREHHWGAARARRAMIRKLSVRCSRYSRYIVRTLVSKKHDCSSRTHSPGPQCVYGTERVNPKQSVTSDRSLVGGSRQRSALYRLSARQMHTLQTTLICVSLSAEDASWMVGCSLASCIQPCKGGTPWTARAATAKWFATRVCKRSSGIRMFTQLTSGPRRSTISKVRARSIRREMSRATRDVANSWGQVRATQPARCALFCAAPPSRASQRLQTVRPTTFYAAAREASAGHVSQPRSRATYIAPERPQSRHHVPSRAITRAITHAITWQRG